METYYIILLDNLTLKLFARAYIADSKSEAVAMANKAYANTLSRVVYREDGTAAVTKYLTDKLTQLLN